MFTQPADPFEESAGPGPGHCGHSVAAGKGANVSARRRPGGRTGRRKNGALGVGPVRRIKQGRWQRHMRRQWGDSLQGRGSCLRGRPAPSAEAGLGWREGGGVRGGPGGGGAGLRGHRLDSSCSLEGDGAPRGVCLAPKGRLARAGAGGGCAPLLPRLPVCHQVTVTLCLGFPIRTPRGAEPNTSRIFLEQRRPVTVTVLAAAELCGRRAGAMSSGRHGACAGVGKRAGCRCPRGTTRRGDRAHAEASLAPLHSIVCK